MQLGSGVTWRVIAGIRCRAAVQPWPVAMAQSVCSAAVWIPIQVIDASSRRQPRSARSRSTPATGPGTRSHGTGRRLTPPPGEISESPDMGRAPLKWSITMVRVFSVSTENFERGNKTKAEEANLIRQSTPTRVCVPAARLCCIRVSFAGVLSSAHREIRDSFRFLFTSYLKQPARGPELPGPGHERSGACNRPHLDRTGG
jgi:hypothetical protein